MNGFTMIAENYRNELKEGRLKEEEAMPKIRLYDFLSTCEGDDFFDLFDSLAFKDITMNYVKKAVKELTNEGVLNEEQAQTVRNRVNCLLSEQSAKEINK